MTRLVPSAASPLERALATLFDQVSRPDLAGARLYDPHRAPVGFLPFLAWALNVDEWDPAWPEWTKRRVVASAIGVHRKKGTLAAVEDAIGALRITADIQEWFEQVPQGAPHTFTVDIPLNDNVDYGSSAPLVDGTRLMQTQRAIARAKRASQHHGLTVSSTHTADVAAVGVLRSSVRMAGEGTASIVVTAKADVPISAVLYPETIIKMRGRI